MVSTNVADCIPEPVSEPGYAKKNMVLSSRIYTKHSIQPLFESRGVAMIKAALNDKNKHDVNKSIISRPGTYTSSVPLSNTKNSTEYARSNSEPKDRKRPLKNTVIFSDPVVTNQYEYEQTFVDATDYNKHFTIGQKKFLDNKFLPIQRNASFDSYRSPRIKAKLVSYTSQIDDDSEDELITVDSTENEIIRRKLKCASDIDLTPSKRPHESSQEQDKDQYISSEPKELISSISQSGSVSGGLFSAPKVAKIIPLYEDAPQENDTDVIKHASKKRPWSGELNNNYRQRRSRTMSERLNIHSHQGSMSISRIDRSASYDCYGSAANQSTNVSVSELISFKKIQPSTHIDHPMETEISTDRERSNESPNGYFSWFTNLLSSQVSKLIF